MKKMPENIKVGWKRYRVESWSETDARDENRLGDINHIKEVIRITTGVSDAERADTLLHEILHAVMTMWTLDVSDLAQLKDPEETLVSALSNGMSSVLRDNPALLAYLSDVWALTDSV